MAVLVRTTEDSTRDDLEVCIGHVCDQAKAEARRGYAGLHGKRYSDLHETLDDLLSRWLEAR